MNELLQFALVYASRGWHVFPLHGIVNGRCTCGRRDCSSPGKHPLTRHGVKDASIDPDVIREWWSQWSIANIGVATGERSRVVVVDIDLGHRTNTAFGSPGDETTGQVKNVWGSLERVVHKLPRTLTGLTGGGGLHLLYRARFQERVRNRTSSLPGMPDLPGIDLRADGGYVVAPPSLHISGNRYEWLDLAGAEVVRDPHHHYQNREADREPFEPRQDALVVHPGRLFDRVADAPVWLKDEEPYAAPVAAASAPRFTTGDGTAYGRAALDRALTSLRCAPVGQRNHILNREAFCVAQLVAGGELLDSAARSSLLEAAGAIGLTQHETRLTINSAFGAGVTEPRVAPHRLRGSS